MAYTSVLPVHRLDRSIDYVKDRAKTTKSAGSLEEAIDYALNREKTEETIFEDAIGDMGQLVGIVAKPRNLPKKFCMMLTGLCLELCA